MFDVILRGGTIIDGSGAEGVIGDIAIKDGMIAAIGEIPTTDADEIVDVTGLIVAPGWVDTDMSREFDPKGDDAWSTTEEITRCALFLAAHAPRDMTGQFLDIFGS